MVLRAIDSFLKKSLKLNVGFLRRIYNADSSRSKIFFNYHHDHVREWVEWVKKQDDDTQKRAFAKLIEHLNEHPRIWNKVTLDVIVAISYFRYPESVSILKNFVLTAHRMCDVYPILSEGYVSAIKGLILNDEEVACHIIDEQIALERNKKQVMHLVSSVVPLFAPHRDITNILVNLITYSELTAREREYIIANLAARSEEQLSNIYIKSVERFIDLDRKVNSFGKDCLKIFAIILSRAVKLFDDEKFLIVEDLCTSNYLSLSSFEIIGAALGDRSIGFNIENIYKFYAYASSMEEKKCVRNSLAQRNALTYQELMVTRAYDLRETFPFTRQPLFVEKLAEKIRLPLDLEDFCQIVSDYLAPQVIQNDMGEEVHGGGLLLTGEAFWEKLYISRAIAAEKKWKFIFLDYQYFQDELENPYFDELKNELTGSPYSLVFIENIHLAKDDKQQILFERLREYATETSIYYTGSIPKELSISNPNVKNEIRSYLPRDLFPAMREIPYCTLEKQSRIWDRLLLELGANRAKDTVLDTEILISSYDVYSIEFDVYIRTYFHICLLIYGQLVSLEEMQEIGVF